MKQQWPNISKLPLISGVDRWATEAPLIAFQGGVELYQVILNMNSHPFEGMYKHLLDKATTHAKDVCTLAAPFSTTNLLSILLFFFFLL